MKIVTLRDVGHAAGFDASTVSLALRGHPRIPGPTRECILRAAARIGYRPDPALGRLAARRWLGRRSSETATLGYLAQIHSPHEDSSKTDRYLLGVREQAERLGYRVDVFNPQEYPNDRRLSDAIYARGIRGLIVGQRTVLDREHHLAWDRFCVVQAGLNLRTEVLTLVRCDLDSALRQCHGRLCAAGYRRILIYLVAQKEAASDLILQDTVKLLPPVAAKAALKVMVHRWEDFADRHRRVLAQIRAWRPDAVLTLHGSIVESWKKAGLRVPEEFAVACLNVDPEAPEMAGTNLQMDRVGAAAVDLVDIKLRRFEYGRPPSRLTVLIEPIWTPGESLPEPSLSRASRLRKASARSA